MTLAGSMPLPLSGIRVLDLGRYIAAPFCAQLLSTQGAEVIRVEPPEGAPDREVMPVGVKGRGGLYLQVNANKKSLTLDYAKPEGRAVLEKLIQSADVLVINLPHKSLVSLGLDYQTLQSIKPDIILTTISAFSSDGHDKNRTGFDGTGQALSGAMYLTGFGDAPTREAVSYVDYATAMSAAFATVSAILARAQTGKGQHVKCSLMGTALTMINPMLMEEASGYRTRRPIGNRSPIAGPSDLFHAKDGWLMIQIIGDPMFKRWTKLMNRPDLLKNPLYKTDSDRGENGDALSRIQQEWCETRTVEECLKILEEHRLPACPCLTPKETLRMAGFADYTKAMNVDGLRLPIVDKAISLGKASSTLHGIAPSLGEDTHKLLKNLGISEKEIEELKKNLIA